MTQSILSILDELAATPSTNEKEAIIRRNKDNTLLKSVFERAYNPMINFGIKKIPEYTPSKPNQADTLDSVLDSCRVFHDRVVTGNAAIEHLSKLLSNLVSDDAVVLERIIQRDLRCGCSDTIASRVWPGFVPTFDVMLSHKDISGIKFPAFAQKKSDGSRCLISRISNKAVAFSRSGKPIELRGVFDEAICQMVNDGETLDGELLYTSPDGKIVDRKTGNGYVNRAVKNTITEDEAKGLVFACWDKVDYTSTIPYNIRIEELTKTYVKVKNPKIFVLETIIVNNKEEAEVFFQKCLSEGEEGAMVKNMYHVWQPKRTKDLGKMKAEEVADLKIVALQEGTGKYAGMLGAFICETSDGLLTVGVGTGINDEDRKMYFDEKYIGRVIEVKYNQIISDKTTGKHSLFLPRFMGIREDKFVANSLNELK